MSEQPVTLEELRGVDLFDGLDEAELTKWVELAHPRRVLAGGVIAEQGEEPPGLQLLLDGRAQAFILAQGQSEPVGHHTAPGRRFHHRPVDAVNQIIVEHCTGPRRGHSSENRIARTRS